MKMEPIVDYPEKDHRAAIENIIAAQSIRTLYQPIVSLTDGSIFGYEGLTRGPEQTPYHSPIALFDAAEGAGLLYPLDRLAREKAIRNAVAQEQQLLFLNISSHIIFDPNFIPGRTLEVLHEQGLKPSNVVFEITERSSIEDFSAAKKLLEHYRSQGYRIAIDDAGAGYSSLQAIAELHPDFIKIDRSLITNIHLDRMKEHLVETFVAFAEKMQVKLIAEGIEKTDELMKLTKLGVHLVQGFLLGRPSPKAAVVPEDLFSKIRQQRNGLTGSGGSYWTIGDLAAPIRKFPPHEMTSHVADYFHGGSAEQAVVIVQDSMPVGLVMKERLFQMLSGQYGYSLYGRKPVASVMDAEPLIVDEALSVEQASQLAMAREKNKLYDLVIITRQGQFVGVASIRSILECLTNVRMETAKVANPLTGLPGNIQIHRELNRRLSEGRRFSVIYADLDFFKWFNDRFGFKRGDQLIQFTADTIQYAISVCGTPFDFVGHIGGDDFIAITSSPDPKQLSREIIRRFDQGVGLLMEEDEITYVEDRSGNRIEANRVTVSLSLIVCECEVAARVEDISQEAARLKKKAKEHLGSVCVCRTFGTQEETETIIGSR